MVVGPWSWSLRDGQPLRLCAPLRLISRGRCLSSSRAKCFPESALVPPTSSLRSLLSFFSLPRPPAGAPPRLNVEP